MKYLHTDFSSIECQISEFYLGSAVLKEIDEKAWMKRNESLIEIGFRRLALSQNGLF